MKKWSRRASGLRRAAGIAFGLLVLVQGAGAQMLESFETWSLTPGQTAPAGWRKWQEAGGRGWSNTWVGRMPMPGWMSGTNEAPPDADAGSRMAYVTYTHGGSKTNDLWLITPTLKGVTATSTVSFWYRSSFSNFADSIRVHVSTNPEATRKSDFSIQAFLQDYPRNWPNDCGPGVKCDFPSWTNIVVDIGSVVPAGTEIRLGFQEYWYNNWYDVRANEMDVVRSDLWAAPVVELRDVRLTSPTTAEVDYDAFAGYPEGSCYVGWSPDPLRMEPYQAVPALSGANTCVISNLPAYQTLYINVFADHSRAGRVYAEPVEIHPGDSAGEGLLFESFEDWPLQPGQSAPPGWKKWQEAGGRGWSNTWVGRQPMPGWMSGTNEAPPDPEAGSRMAYVTYTHGGSKTNDLWLISPTIKNVPSNYAVSFWYRSSFSNFADSISVQVSENTNAYRKSDFSITAFQQTFPRNWPNDCTPPVKCDFPPWTNIVVDVGALVTPGSDIRLGIQEYYNNNWYDVRANEMDVIRGGARVRNALRFDGTDDQVVLPLTNHPTAYTVEAWVKRDSTGAMSILAASDNNPMAAYSHQLRMTAGGAFEHYLWDGAGKTVTGTTVAQTGRWYHVCGTAQNGGVMRLYVNGAEEGTAAAVGTMTTVRDAVYVGAATGGGFRAFDGWIDEVRTWTDVRTPDEILDAMNLYLRGIEDHLEACYRFDSTWGSDLFDSSRGGQDAWFGPAVDSYIWTHQARQYDGVDDFDEIPQATAPPPAYTVEAWVRPQSTGIRNILVLTDGDATTSYNRQLRINAAGQAEFYAYDGAARLVTGTTVLPSNQWTHVAGTATTGGTMRLYVNGVEENSGAAGNTLWPTSRTYQVAAQACWSPRYTWFKGRIRDVGITNRVKSAVELLATVSNGTWCATNQMPQWGAAETPQGDYVAARQWSNRGVWQTRTSAGSGRGMRLMSPVPAATNFLVAGDNNQTGNTNTFLPAGPPKGRQKREWFLDVHGATQQVVHLVFDPIAGGSSRLLSSTNDYLLLYRTATNSAFTVLRPQADALAAGEVTFTAVAAAEGYYALGVGAPPPPSVQPATNITAHSFHANWITVTNVDGYHLDVSGNAAFSSYVAGYQDRTVGDVSTASVTGLLPGVTYYYRLRSERDGVPGTNSASESLTTLTEGAIGIDPAFLNFSCVYGEDPAVQTFVLTNSGQTAYAFANNVEYSPGASGWLAAVAGTVASNASLVRTAQVAAATLNAGSYWATNSITSPTATNSPQAQFVSLTVNKANQAITFPAIPNQLTTNGVGLAGTVNSGLTITYTVFSGPALIAGGTNLTFTGAGSVSIVASQPGSTNWNAAAMVTNTFTVAKAAATVTLGSLAQDYDGTPRVATATTTPGGLTVDFTYEGSTTAPTVVGTYAVTGTINDVMYQGSAAGSLVVSKGDQTIAFPVIADQLTTNEVGLAATASSGLGVSFAAASGPASIAGGTNLTFSTSGQVSIAASQAGDGNWNAAPDVTNTFNVSKAVAQIFLGDLAQTYDGTARTASATTMPAGLTVVLTYGGNAWAPTNAGPYAVTGTVNDLMYQGVATGVLVVARAQDTITFGATNQAYDGTGKAVTAVSTSGSPVAVTYDGATNLPVTVGTYAVTGIVDTANWEATNTTVLTIVKGDQAITNFLPPDGAHFMLGAVTGVSAQASSGLAVG
ncbi:MAG TPA: MBG domain-containing protein, partial [Kiritimatiellia bacterium]|nr:MBG domain-containing protein [Kiritimatiellia bacterium]